MYTIAFAGEKGGISKTASATTLTALLATYKRKVILVDNNPTQSNASERFQMNRELKTIADIYIKGDITKEELQKIIKHTKYPYIDMIPGNETLLRMRKDKKEGAARPEDNSFPEAGPVPDDEMLYIDESKIPVNPKVNEDYILRNALDLVKDDYDVCIIDCGPSINTLVRNALCCSDIVLMPVNDSMECYNGFNKTFLSVKEVRQKINPGLKINVFFGCVSPYTNTYKYFYEIYKRKLGDLLIDVCIRRDNTYVLAGINGLPLPYFVTYSNALYDYERLLQKLDLLTGKQAKLLSVKIRQSERKEESQKKTSKKKGVLIEV